MATRRPTLPPLPSLQVPMYVIPSDPPRPHRKASPPPEPPFCLTPRQPGGGVHVERLDAPGGSRVRTVVLRSDDPTPPCTWIETRYEPE